MSEWISVKDRLPEDKGDVLIYTKSKDGIRAIDIGYCDGTRLVNYGCAEITHWMPLPELPKESEVESDA